MSFFSTRTHPSRIVLLAALLTTALPSIAGDYPVKPTPFTEVHITGGLWKSRQETNRLVTVPYAFQQCEDTQRLKNFDLAAETMKRRAAGETNFQNKPLTIFPFDDSDVYKAVEGAAFTLSLEKDPALESRLDRYIAQIAAAQEPDGYLYTFRTMHPDSPAHEWIHQKRWLSDPVLSHELYNLGHLYEAGVAHYQATGKTNLLAICLKSADLIDRDFGRGQLKIAPGHQVIEMGLAKLYRTTGDTRYLKLAKFFLDVRGPNEDPYNQRHLRVVDQAEAVGHAVRANYMYSGMADVAALTGDSHYIQAINAIWENASSRKMHITGGVGALAAGEAYGADYELPNKCYNETCAAIAYMMWTHRMFLLTGEARYMDVFERTLFNGFLSGVSISGDRFFYPNPLEYDGHTVNNHGHAGRAPWFGCACCPPNVLRTLAALTGYFYAVRDDQVFVNLYAESEAAVRVREKTVRLAQKTDYPWNGRIQITVTPPTADTFTLRLRLPGWAQGRPVPSDLYAYVNAEPAAWSLTVNGQPVSTQPTNGYLTLAREWKPGDVVELNLPMIPRRVVGNSKITATRGRVALERGPVVYCLEGRQDTAEVADCVLPDDAVISAKPETLLNGCTVLEIDGAARAQRTGQDQLTTTKTHLTAIPYALWNNRGLHPMEVWVARTPEFARLKPTPTLATESKVSVSFHRDGMTLAAINDQIMPLNATDGFASDFDFWPHKGTTEWVQYDFQKPSAITETTVAWFDDTGSGECRLPVSWRLLYKDAAGAWKPVTVAADYPIHKDKPDIVPFQTVTTSSVRLELRLQEGFSSGLYEWSVK
jgi:DUF1680 family protein